MKQASLIRDMGDTNQVCGRLSVDNSHWFTLERGDNGNQHGISCIPTGVYVVKWGHMNSANRDHYEVQNVPHRDAIFIHGGNKFADSHGCILLGEAHGDINHDGETDITSSGDAIKEFEALLNKEDFELTIVENF